MWTGKKGFHEVLTSGETQLSLGALGLRLWAAGPLTGQRFLFVRMVRLIELAVAHASQRTLIGVPRVAALNTGVRQYMTIPLNSDLTHGVIRIAPKTRGWKWLPLSLAR
jgi:hypothetical protein